MNSCLVQFSTYDEVYFEVRLITGTKWIFSTDCIHVFVIFFVLLKILVDLRESHWFMQTTSKRATLILDIGGSRNLLPGSFAEKMAV
jgi:hypothetical protein